MLPSGRGICVTRRDRLSPAPLLWVVVQVEVQRVCWWRIYHIYLEDYLFLSGIKVKNCWIITVFLGPCVSGNEAIYEASAPPGFISLLLSGRPLWINIWLPHIEFHMCLICVLCQTSDLASWSYHSILDRNPLTPAWLSLHVNYRPWRCCGPVELLLWVGGYQILPWLLVGKWYGGVHPGITPLQTCLGWRFCGGAVYCVKGVDWVVCYIYKNMNKIFYNNTTFVL